MANGVDNTNTRADPESSKEKPKSEDNKLSVLETHGYTVGRNVGSGSYATVKVNFYDTDFSPSSCIGSPNGGIFYDRTIVLRLNSPRDFA